jgi:hypothetical protein
MYDVFVVPETGDSEEGENLMNRQHVVPGMNRSLGRDAETGASEPEKVGG